MIGLNKLFCHHNRGAAVISSQVHISPYIECISHSCYVFALVMYIYKLVIGSKGTKVQKNLKRIKSSKVPIHFSV